MSFSHDVADLVAASNDSLHAAADWWQRIPLGEVCDILNGFPFQSHYFNDSQGAPIIRIRDVTSGACATFYSGAIPEGYWVEPSDMVVGMDGDFNCRLWPSEPGLLNQRVCKLTPHEDFLDKEFLSYTLPGYLRLINDHTHSITVKHLSSKTIAEILFPLPPRAEQRRLVAKLNSLFERTRRAREALSHIPRLINNYKRTILEAAFRGDLTKDWRHRKGIKTPWQIDTVRDAISDIRYGTSKKCTPELHGAPVLRIPNVTSTGIDLNDLKFTDLTEKELEKLSLNLGDVLVVRSNGSVDLVGRAVVVDEKSVGYAYAGYLIRLRPKPSAVDPFFLSWMLLSPQTRKIVEVNTRSTSGVHNINSEELQSLPLPIPSLGEQCEAVRLIQNAFDWLDAVSDDVEKSMTLLDQLDQAHLAKGFRGELVPQDPSDEPASILLDRILTTNTNLNAKIQRRRRQPEAVK